jgi:hypothetical protein
VTDVDALPPQDTQSPSIKTPPKLTPGEHHMLQTTIVLLLAVGTIGLFVSFQSVSAKAAAWGFETPQLLPIAIDLAIPGFTIAHLLLIRMDMELAWVRAVPWALTGVTVYLNIQAGTTIAARIGHGALPLVWVVCSEIAGHVYRVLIGAATGKRMERIRRARFFLAPLSTSAMWRRMVLWEETSYGNAITRERNRVLARADLRERHGRLWRWTAPIRQRALLRLGELAPVALQDAITQRHEGAPERATEALPPVYAERHESAPVAAVVAYRPAIESAPHSATVDLTKRPRSATTDATEAPQAAPRKRHQDATHAAPKAPRQATTKRPKSAPRDAARDAIKALYTELGRRPLESEMVAALKTAKLPHSRQFANARRLEIEREHPGLAALGSDNVRPLTGTDN